MEQAPVQIEMSTDLAVWSLVLLGAFGLLALFGLTALLGTLTGRHRHQHGHRHPAPPANVEAPHVASPPPARSNFFPFVLAMALVAGAVMLMLTVGYVSLPRPVSDTAETQVATVDYSTSDSVSSPEVITVADPEALVEEESPSDDSTGMPENAEEAADKEPELPHWARKKQTIVATGQVPDVLFVASSGLYASEDEARAEAIQRAVRGLQQRLAETYPMLASSAVPKDIFQKKAVQKIHVERRMHSFGAYEEPMYRAYVQYLDAAAVREPIIEHWEQAIASNRAGQYAIGLGILTVLLGTVSAGLRAFSAPKGSRGRPIATALAFAGAGATVLAFLA